MSRFMESRLAASGLEKIRQKILDGVRLDFDDGLALYRTRGLLNVDVPQGAAEQLVDSVLGTYLHALMPGYLDVSAEGEPSERLMARVSLAVANAVKALRA